MSATMDIVPRPGSDLVPDGWCEDVVMPWADEQAEEAALEHAAAQLAGLQAAYDVLGADTLELTKARRYLEVRWGELLGGGSSTQGKRTDLSPASEKSQPLQRMDRHLPYLAAALKEEKADA